MPSMLDARVSLSLMDVVRGENQFDEDYEWVEADEVGLLLQTTFLPLIHFLVGTSLNKSQLEGG